MKQIKGPEHEHNLVENDSFVWRDSKAFESAKGLIQNYIFRLDTVPPAVAGNTKSALNWIKHNVSRVLREQGWTIAEVRVQCQKVQHKDPSSAKEIGTSFMQFLWWLEAWHAEAHSPAERDHKIQRII